MYSHTNSSLTNSIASISIRTFAEVSDYVFSTCPRTGFVAEIVGDVVDS
jgi:hypothetical protein